MGLNVLYEDRSFLSIIIQPDPATRAGLTEGKKICDMAPPSDIAYDPFAAPDFTYGARQCSEAVTPSQLYAIHEHHQAPLLIQENNDMCKYNYQPGEWILSVPEKGRASD